VKVYAFMLLVGQQEGHQAVKTSVSKHLETVDIGSGQSTARSTVWIWRVSVCTIRMLRKWRGIRQWRPQTMTATTITITITVTITTVLIITVLVWVNLLLHTPLF